MAAKEAPAGCADTTFLGMLESVKPDGNPWLLFLVACLLTGPTGVIADNVAQTAEEIRAEALRPNTGEIGRPLPLAASWNTGTRKNTYDPGYQIKMIERGHHLLPWFALDMPKGWTDVKSPLAYYQKALKRCAELDLPISFISTQWERLLSDDAAWLKLPPSKNPNVENTQGSIVASVSPFGPVNPWFEVGHEWLSSSTVKSLQLWYPNPPKIIFISNNEHRKLVWHDAATDKRYIQTHGLNTTDEDKRQAVGEGWIERYRALQNGMREGLGSADWRQNSIFVGYEAFGGPSFGRWYGWTDYSLATRKHLEPWPWPLAWDGGSPSYYAHDWNPSTDHNVWSPLIESMNWVFMQEEAYRLNPGFWFEISIWDGNQPGSPSDKRAYYAKLGQSYSPQRYAGMVKFGMWLLRPRVLREFRNPDQTLAETEPYFLEIVKAVDSVYDNPILKGFWRTGRLVPNRHHAHPYQASIPPEYSAKDRWFLLDTNLDSQWPWGLQTEIPVFSLCLEKGTAPNREWLVYAHSPLGNKSTVTVTIPNYGNITVDTEPSGNYYLVSEKNKTAKPVIQ